MCVGRDELKCYNQSSKFICLLPIVTAFMQLPSPFLSFCLCFSQDSAQGLVGLHDFLSGLAPAFFSSALLQQVSNVLHLPPSSTYKSSLLNKSGGNVGLPLSWKMWLGVRASMSLGSSLDGVMGQALNIASASHIAVCRVSLSKVCCFSTE